jgi:polysaccharide export outer membrane protein
MAKWILLALVSTIPLAGCSTPKLVGGAEVRAVSSEAMPAPTGTDQILQQRAYVIGPFDKVTVDVYGVPDLSRTVQVDAGGQISLPLAGTIEASGKTTGELAGLIEARLRGQYIRDPHVTVNTDTVNQMITVDGAVNQPGSYPVQGRMTLMRAVANARGLTEFANTNYVVVFRRVNNQDLAALYDLRSIRQGIYADPEVYANDIVLIEESRARRIFKDLIQSSSLITTPLLAVLR